MSLDEAEQFLIATVLKWGYPSQPPLYSWIVHIISSISGLNIYTLVFVKFSILFLFYSVFYITARYFWEPRPSLAVTGSLMLFPLYAYEFNRDLSHSILVTLAAALTFLIYIRMIRARNVLSYIFIGLIVALGILSKYNFFLFLIALIFASLSTKEGRRILFDKRIFISLLVCLSVLLPHILWLVQENFLPFQHAMREARSGSISVNSPIKAAFSLLSAYAGLVIFLAVFFIFFFPFISAKSRSKSDDAKILFFASAFGLIIPICVAILIRSPYFAERWLAPIMFLIPLSCFHMVDLNAHSRRLRALRWLAALILLLVLVARIFAGFMPDITGRVERIHIPFQELSVRLSKMLAAPDETPIRKDIAIVTDDAHIAANLMIWMPGIRFVHLWQVRGNKLNGLSIPSQDVIILWNANKLGKDTPGKYLHYYPSVSATSVQAPYLHAKKLPPFVLGIGFVEPRNEQYEKPQVR